MKKVLALMMSLLVALTLSACSGDSGISGTYELKEMSVAGVTVTPDDALWDTTTQGQEAKIILESNDNCSVDIFGQKGTGTYEVDGSTVTITIDGDPQEFTLKDNQLIAEIGGTSLVFEK